MSAERYENWKPGEYKVHLEVVTPEGGRLSITQPECPEHTALAVMHTLTGSALTKMVQDREQGEVGTLTIERKKEE